MCTEKEIRFFPNEEIFKDHIKHFKNNAEPWDLLPNEKKLKSICQKFDKSNVLKIKEVYKLIVPILKKGIKTSLEYPLSVTFSEKKPGENALKKLFY